jgi:hypothetical protein
VLAESEVHQPNVPVLVQHHVRGLEKEEEEERRREKKKKKKKKKKKRAEARGGGLASRSRS